MGKRYVLLGSTVAAAVLGFLLNYNVLARGMGSHNQRYEN